MTATIGGSSEDYNPFYCNFWLIEREKIDKNDFTRCDSLDEHFPFETKFLDGLRLKGYIVTKLDHPGCLRFDENDDGEDDEEWVDEEMRESYSD